MALTPAQTRFLAWVALAVAAWWLLSLLAPVLTPFLVAAVMAYALHPVVERMHRWYIPRWLGAAIAIALLMLVLLAVALMVVPVVTRQWPLLRDQIPLLLDNINLWMAPWAARLGIDAQIDVPMVRDALRRLVAGHDGAILDHILASARIGGSAALAVLGNLVLMPIAAYFLLLDWTGLKDKAKAFVPPVWKASAQRFLDETDQVLGQYLRGQLLVMAILAVLYSVGLSLAGLDLALPIGIFTGLAAFVPYIGFGVGFILGVLAAFLQFQDWQGVALVIVAFTVVQLVESSYITPRLLGERIGLHPIAVIFALMAFGHVFGFVGVLIALPTSAVMLVAVRRAKAVYLASSLYTHGSTQSLLPDPPLPDSPPPDKEAP
jgi:predicted PurR-regulated permease PerM